MGNVVSDGGTASLVCLGGAPSGFHAIVVTLSGMAATVKSNISTVWPVVGKARAPSWCVS